MIPLNFQYNIKLFRFPLYLFSDIWKKNEFTRLCAFYFWHGVEILNSKGILSISDIPFIDWSVQIMNGKVNNSVNGNNDDDDDDDIDNDNNEESVIESCVMSKLCFERNAFV